MELLRKRCSKIIDELALRVYEDRDEIKEIFILDGRHDNCLEVNNIDDKWTSLYGIFWGGKDRNGWIRFNIELNEKYLGKKVALFVSTGIDDFDKEEATNNPQMMIYINNELIQGLDINHREVSLTEKSNGSESFKCDIKINSGMYDRRFRIKVEVVIVNDDTRKLYYNLKVPFDIVRNLDENCYEGELLIDKINKAINLIDFRKPYTKIYYDSIDIANEYIENALLNNESISNRITPKASVIGHTHIDIAWLWTEEQTREKVARSFSTVLKLMKEYPEYKFMSSTPQLYQYVKEDYPMLYAEIRERVEEGRWEVEGGMWVEPDCNLTSGESLVRQIIFGKRFFKDEFDVDSKVLWLPDVFGYNGALPQIMKKSGIDYFMSCKMGWNDTNRMPYDTFMWKGIDGSEVLSHFITTTYPRASVTSYATDYNGQLFPETVMGAWNKYRHRVINDDVLITFGYGDGGGGATKEMLENNRRMAKGIVGCPRTDITFVKEYFDGLNSRVKDSRYLPTWCGEIYFEYHRGTYTSMAREKKYNRKNEIAIRNAELLSILNNKINMVKYDKELLEKCWKLILKNQFHDILPGSCIEEVYEVTEKEHRMVAGRLLDVIGNSLESICSAIRIDDDSLVVFNTLGQKRSDIVEIQGEEFLAPVKLLDTDGKYVEMQQGYNGNYIFFAKDIPAVGYKVYKIDNAAVNVMDSRDFSISKYKMSNKFFDVIFNDKGDITSIFDVRNDREVLKVNRLGNELVVYEDKPLKYDNWNMSEYYKEKSWKVDNIVCMDILEDGPIRRTLRIKREFMDSIITQDISIYSDLDRIDFYSKIDWKEEDVVLKAHFPIDINASKATYDMQFGNIERNTHNNTTWDSAQYEVPAHKWADLSDYGYGVSILNDCKYGYGIKESDMNITLLKSGTYPNPNADKELHEFMYSLYPHNNDWRDGGTELMASSVNNPLIYNRIKCNKGNLPEVNSFLSIENENIVIDAVKKSESDDALVLRVHEYFNCSSKVLVKSYFKVTEVWECNLLEENIKEIDVNTEGFAFEIKPYEIKTFKLYL